MSIQINESALREYLLANDEEYRRLVHEQQSLDSQLESIVARYRAENGEGRFENPEGAQNGATALRETDLKYGAEPITKEDARQAETSLPLHDQAAETEPPWEDFDCEWDIRLTPPPGPQQKIKVKLKFIGNEYPRISFDPEND